MTLIKILQATSYGITQYKIYSFIESASSKVTCIKTPSLSGTLPEVDNEVRDFSFYYFLGIFHATFCKIDALFLVVLTQSVVHVHALS